MIHTDARCRSIGAAKYQETEKTKSSSDQINGLDWMDFNGVDSVILAGTCWQLKTLVSSLASHCASQLATACDE